MAVWWCNIACLVVKKFDFKLSLYNFGSIFSLFLSLLRFSAHSDDWFMFVRCSYMPNRLFPHNEPYHKINMDRWTINACFWLNKMLFDSHECRYSHSNAFHRLHIAASESEIKMILPVLTIINHNNSESLDVQQPISSPRRNKMWFVRCWHHSS